jgi:hypothetical protein
MALVDAPKPNMISRSPFQQTKYSSSPWQGSMVPGVGRAAHFLEGHLLLSYLFGDFPKCWWITSSSLDSTQFDDDGNGDIAGSGLPEKKSGSLLDPSDKYGSRVFNVFSGTGMVTYLCWRLTCG